MKTFNPSSEQITPEWLINLSDRYTAIPLSHISLPGCEQIKHEAVFEVEQEDDGYLHVTVSWHTTLGTNPCYMISVTSQSYTAPPKTADLGLYTLKDDLLALLEIFARGNHF